MVEELDSRLKRCPCCGGETVLGSLYGCRPWVTYWLPRYRSLLSPFFSRRNIEKRGGLSPGQRAGVLVPHPARAQPELLLPQLQAASHPGGRVPHPVATTWHSTKKRARL